MKKILVSLLMTFLLVPCINAEEVSMPSETETITETTEVNQNEVVPQVGETTDTTTAGQNEEASQEEKIETPARITETGNQEELTQQELQVEEKTEAEIELEKFVQEIAPNNVVTMKVPKSFTNYYEHLNYSSEDMSEDYGEVFSNFAYDYIKNYDDDILSERQAFLSNISDDLSKATLDVNYQANGNYENKKIEVSLKWQEEDPKILELVKPYAENLLNQKLHYTTTDLNLLKYLQDENIQTMDIVNVLDTIITQNILTSNSTSNDGIEYNIKSSQCGGFGFSFGCGGTFAVGYNDIYYVPIKNISSGVFYHIYIPDEIENTPDAYIKAAKERIDNYFGTNDIKIEKGMTLTEYFGEDVSEYWEDVIGDYTISQTGEYCYKVIINNVEFDFLIIRDSNKVGDPNHVTGDVKTGATIETTSNEVPVDATISVGVIEKTSEVIKNVAEKIKAEIDEVMAIDFKLFSKSKNDFIKNISTGEFVVSVPIIDNLKDKNLVAYYIDDNGKIEKHPVTLKDGVATFTTTHFSVYTIAEDNSIGVPNTYDGIMNFVVMGVIGIIGIGVFFTLKMCRN